MAAAPTARMSDRCLFAAMSFDVVIRVEGDFDCRSRMTTLLARGSHGSSRSGELGPPLTQMVPITTLALDRGHQ